MNATLTWEPNLNLKPLKPYANETQAKETVAENCRQSDKNILGPV